MNEALQIAAIAAGASVLCSGTLAACLLLHWREWAARRGQRARAEAWEQLAAARDELAGLRLRLEWLEHRERLERQELARHAGPNITTTGPHLGAA